MWASFWEEMVCKELKDLKYLPTFFSKKKEGFAYLRRPKGEFSIKEATYESSRCLECDLSPN